MQAYVAHNDADANTDDTSFGLGAIYEIGGAEFARSVQRGYDGRATADIGLRFTF